MLCEKPPHRLPCVISLFCELPMLLLKLRLEETSKSRKDRVKELFHLPPMLSLNQALSLPLIEVVLK